MDKQQRTDDIKRSIYEFLKQGMFKKDASRMTGISEDTYLRWYKEDADFADRVEASILEYKQSLIQNLNIQAKTNGILALKILQWRFPKDWIEPQREDEKEHEASTKEIADMIQAMFDKPGKDEDNKKNLPEHFS